MALQEAMRKSVREFASLLGVETTTITNWRNGLSAVKPRFSTQAILDTTLKLHTSPEDRERFEQIVAAGETGWRDRGSRPSTAKKHPPSEITSISGRLQFTAPPPAFPVELGSDYVETLHGRIRQLVQLDLSFGGDQSSGLALQYFRSVHQKLGVARCDAANERDLYAAAGELGEVTGWLLYDAGEHELVRRVNNEALHLSKLAGDRTMELLTLQNVSMHAVYLGRPVEALRIAQMVLEQQPPSPRLEAMFRVREARALASLGDETSSARALAKARSLYLDGIQDNDPPWVWWISDHELGWHEATILADRGDWTKSADVFRASVEAIPIDQTRSRYIHLASLLNAQIRAQAWRDAADTICRILPLVDEIRSTRTAAALAEAVDYLDTVEPATPIRDEGRQLRNALLSSGYEVPAPAP
ncbi:hypothetical protein ACWDSJ_26275 [Nocardia sp. NPDC003482]